MYTWVGSLSPMHVPGEGKRPKKGSTEDEASFQTRRAVNLLLDLLLLNSKIQ